MSLVRRFAEISKTEAQADGTLKVWGYASSAVIDSDGETITAEAMKAAIPDYMKFGAVREMHQAKAAGTAIEAEVQADGRTYFGAHIVDPVAVKKVETNVYKGFSIGGKVTSRDTVNKNEITGLKLVEVSLVDRPANPEAVFTMYKAELDEKPTEPVVTEPPAAAVVDPVKKAEVAPVDKDSIEQLAAMINKAEISPKDLVVAGLQAIAKVKAGPRKPIVVDQVKKGMCALSTFVDLIMQIGWLASDCAAEAAWEGDKSPIPAQLKDWLASGVTICEAMAAEETSEMLTNLKGQVEIIAAAAAAEALKVADAAQPGNVLKAALVQTPAEPIQKVEDLMKAELAKRDGLIDALTKRLELIEKQPMPPGIALRAVTKGQDVSAGDPDAVLKGLGDLPANATAEQRATHEIKKVFRTGGRPVG